MEGIPRETLVNYDPPIEVASDFVPMKKKNIGPAGKKKGSLPPMESKPNVEMFLDALEMIIYKMKEQQIEMTNIKSISGCAQQHGSVYFSKKELNINRDFDMRLSLSENFNKFKLLATSYCPIWMDAPTTNYVKEIEDKFTRLGLFLITGNKAYERFTINQISKISFQSSKFIV